MTRIRVLLICLVVSATAAVRGIEHGQAAAGAASGGSLSVPGSAFEPTLSPSERTYFAAARRATIARDRACSGFAGPELTSGSPSRALASILGILRRPAKPAVELVDLLERTRRPWSRAAELYISQIRRARSTFGASFYVIPAGNVTGQRGVPARCEPEQRAALRRALRHVAKARRTRILVAQARYLAYMRYQALHPEGICAAWATRHTMALDAGEDFGCATMADLERYGILVDANAPLRRDGVFWTVVPDGVATASLRFAPGQGIPPPRRGRRTTMTVRVVNNMVVAAEPYGAPFPATILLRSARGRVIRRTAVTSAMPMLCAFGC
jgi:hypothetical protein